MGGGGGGVMPFADQLWRTRHYYHYRVYVKSSATTTTYMPSNIQDSLNNTYTQTHTHTRRIFIVVTHNYFHCGLIFGFILIYA